MNRLLLILGLGFLLASCSKEEIAPYPCLDGNCNSDFEINDITIVYRLKGRR